MEKFLVTGMSCAACQARVEKAVNGVDGVTACSVSLLTNSMGVEGDFDTEAVIKAVVNAGYGASVMTGNDANGIDQANSDVRKMLEDHETPKLKKRLILSIILLIPLMYVSMGHTMFGFPLPKVMCTNNEGRNLLYSGIVQMILAIIVMIINRKFFVSGFKGLIHRAPNMDTLIALGSAASFVYSVPQIYALYLINFVGKTEASLSHLMNGFYFESCAMILVFITIGKTLESFSKGKTTDALKKLVDLAPTVATVVRNNKEQKVNVNEVRIGDVFVVRPGEKIPVDGVVLEGTSAVNEAFLTGESMPCDKEKESEVYAATINQSGFLKCQATKVGEDTSLSKVIKLVADNASTKAPIARIADRISGIFVPAVIGISLVTFVIWMLLGKDMTFIVSRAICVLVVSCPCALGLATPVAIMAGNGVGASRGILFKTAEALQELGRADIVVLDKTGTITAGTPLVTDVCPFGISEKELLSLAYSLESKSEHPLAGAIVEFCSERQSELKEATDFAILPGNGLKAVINNAQVIGGNLKYIEENAVLTEEIKSKVSEFSSESKTPVLFASEGKVIGLFGIRDKIKDDSKAAIDGIKKLGIKVIMLTGDNKKTASRIGEIVGVDEVIADVLPDGKDEVIKSLSSEGKVVMVGDGINDAPALISSHVGVAIGAGSDVAIDSASVVLTRSTLMDLLDGIRLSRFTYKVIIENLFWALFYNVLLIPLAAGVYSSLFGITMEPMYGAAAMSISSFIVVVNALRLNTFKGSTPKNLPDNLADNSEEKSDYDVKIIAKGLMCEHCEATCKKALEDLPEVSSATPNFKTGIITVKLNENIDNSILKNAITSKGYKVKKITNGKQN